MKNISDYQYKIALNCFNKISPKRLDLLLDFFKDEDNIFKASTKDLIKNKITEKTAYELQEFKKTFDFEKIVKELEKESIQVLARNDEGYPNLLKEIYDPPHLLYYKGKLKDKSHNSISVVGSRKFSRYGEQVVEKVVGDLARKGVSIVSGLALGIDALAHATALKNNGYTIAVLGTGLDKKSLYPKSNSSLAEKIVEAGGLIISEFPLETPPDKYNFPKRNRIVSGLSLGVFVVEAALKSGTLITAQSALDQNREVFTVPHSIFSTTGEGCNKILKEGANLIKSADDIIDSFDIEKIESEIEIKNNIQTSLEEELILAKLNHEPLHIDEITHTSKMPAPQVSSTLIILEMKGLVKNVGGMEYILIKN